MMDMYGWVDKRTIYSCNNEKCSENTICRYEYQRVKKINKALPI